MEIEEKINELISGIDFNDGSSLAVKRNLQSFDDIIDDLKLQVEFLSMGCKEEKLEQIIALYKAMNVKG